MLSPRSGIAVLLLVLSSCSSSSGGNSAGPGPDAGPGDGAPVDAKPDAPASSEWSCLGGVTLEAPAKPTLTWQLQPVEALSGATFMDMPVSECSSLDVPCASPLFAGITDPTTGIATVSASTGSSGFDGFWRFQASGYYPSLVFSNVPIVNDVQVETGPAWNAADLETALGSLATQWDMTKGIVAFAAFSCNSGYLFQDDMLDPAPKYAAARIGVGVSMSIAPTASGITAGYLAGKTVSTTATQTDASGLGFFVNVPEGWVTLTATVVAGGKTMGTGRVYASAGAVSTIAMSPTH